ncbi:MAG: ABC transporter ATP-binding protein/permease, partial [Bdellovibrionaceae bacterium]|nr:ABC transporter ATP-binding protein/permease [Pseudobdellovibrionaceae bacterium]
MAILALSLCTAVFGLMSPLFQKLFIDRLLGVEDSLAQGRFASWPVEALILAAFFMMLLAAGCGIASVWVGMRESVRIQASLGERMYQKTLRMRSDQLGSRTVGEVVSIYATDVTGATALLEQTLPMGAGIVFPLIFAPFVVNWITRVPLGASITLIGVIVVLNAIFSYRQSRFFFRFKQLAAERTGLVSEWIQNIRVLRILDWVGAFEEKIFEKRVQETANRVAMVTNGQMMGSVGSSISFFINLFGVATLVSLQGGVVTPGELLALLWIFGVFLARPFRQIPWMFTFLLDALTSLRRIESFLADRDEGEFAAPVAPLEDASTPASLDVRGLELRIGRQMCLQEIHLSVRSGEFVAIVGEVGSGKSLLLLSLMGETGATFEDFEIGGKSMKGLTPEDRRRRFSYVPQESFVMSASLRENVALEYGVGANVDGRVVASLGRSQFRLEQENVQGGLEAEIGERGVNLSGGQRQRLSLARVDMEPRPVLLLDDCLSAVDISTERQLIEQLISGAWRERTRLLVTHRLSV